MDNLHSELPLEALADRDVGIKLVGVGGGGSNAVDRLKMENLDRLQLAVINTDFKALSTSPVQDKVLIGTSLTRGLSAGGDPELGAKAAEADADKIAEIVKGTDLVFLVAGLGGGTGSGAAPVVAEIASQNGALVVAFVTLPFSFEGGRRRKQAEESLAELRRVCDAVIPLSNDMLLQEGTEQTSVLDSFARADEWIGRGVKSIWSMLSRTGLINVDFTAVRTVFQQRGGKTLFGLGVGEGENAAMAAFEDLKQCPLLHTPEYARKADRLLVNITGGADLSLTKVNELMSAITDEFGREAHVVMGASIDEGLQGKVEICVMGAADMGGRNFVRRAPAATAPRKPSEKVSASATAALLSADAGPAKSAVSIRDDELLADPNKPKQDEFGFQQEPVENRGSFGKSDRNLFEGQDLDVPTYLRKGIKITV
ncbi:cell division protein FtsZ [Oleiharenicola lentus]|uniref:cell division protein FtsZ n=1 Tax=Oleiharenicola lentus TaxID=2508720 RepID=UPI003F672A39